MAARLYEKFCRKRAEDLLAAASDYLPLRTQDVDQGCTRRGARIGSTMPRNRHRSVAANLGAGPRHNSFRRQSPAHDAGASSAAQAFLIDLLIRRLHGLLEVRPVESGMYLTVWLPPAWSDQDTAAALTQGGIVTMLLSALTLATSRPPGLVLGYAGHSEAAMAREVERVAKVFEPLNWDGRFPKLELLADQS